MTSKRYNTGTLKSISHLYLGEHILHKLLCRQQHSDNFSCIMERGTLPFFLGAVVVKDQSLCDFFQNCFENNNEDLEHMMKKKSSLRSCAKTLMGKH